MPGVIIDCEVNRMDEPEVIEVCVAPVDFVNGKLESIGRCETQLFMPEGTMQPGAIATHQILPEELEGHPASATAQSWTRDVTTKYAATYAIGHNVDFDMGVLGFKRGRRVCSLALAREAITGTDSYSLSALAYHLLGYTRATREKLQGMHRAEADVQMTMCLVEDICTTKRINSWESLHFASEQARIPRRMPFGKHKGLTIAEVPAGYICWLLKEAEKEDGDDIDPYLVKALQRSMKGRRRRA